MPECWNWRNCKAKGRSASDKVRFGPRMRTTGWACGSKCSRDMLEDMVRVQKDEYDRDSHKYSQIFTDY